MRSTNQANWRERVLWGMYPKSHLAQWDPGASCACSLPTTPTCTLYMAFNSGKQWFWVNSSQLCAPRSPRRHSITHIMKRVNETWDQSNYSSAITEWAPRTRTGLKSSLWVELSATEVPTCYLMPLSELTKKHIQSTASPQAPWTSRRWRYGPRTRTRSESTWYVLWGSYYHYSLHLHCLGPESTEVHSSECCCCCC